MQRTIRALAATLLLCCACTARVAAAQAEPRHALSLVASSTACGRIGPLPAACGNIVVDGDSISAGWGSTGGQGLDVQFAGDLHRPARVANVAVGGRPAFVCRQLFSSDVAPHFIPGARFNLIVFHAGDNDISQGRTAEQAYAAFTGYVQQAHAQGWQLIVSTELRRPDFRRDQSAMLSQYNRLLLRNAAGADAVVDLARDPRFADLADRNNSNLFAADHVHPRNAGYAILARMLATAAQPLLPH